MNQLLYNAVMKLPSGLQFAVVLVLVGCARESTVIGKWQLQKGASDPNSVGQDPNLAKRLYQSATYPYEFKADGTFSGPIGNSGTYTVSSHTVTMISTSLKVGAVSTKLDNVRQTADLSGDGKTLTAHSIQIKGFFYGTEDVPLERVDSFR